MIPLISCEGRRLCEFPPSRHALIDPPGLLCLGGELSPALLLAAYRRGIFPWFSEGRPVHWWTPPERGVFNLDRFRPSTRMRRWLSHCNGVLRADVDFAEVMRECGRARDDGGHGWIFPQMVEAYARLHALGHAHSIEVYTADGDRVGGLYGVVLGGAFFAESMFSRRSNASKLALYALAQWLRQHGIGFFDTQMPNPHLLSLGLEVWPRARFEAALPGLLDLTPAWPSGAWTQAFGERAAASLAEGPWPSADAL